MYLAENVLRSTRKEGHQIKPGPVLTKGFIFPAVRCIELPVSSVNSKSFRMATLALAYFSAGKLGLLLANVHSSVSPIWPATGIALAALLLWGVEFWPAVFAGAFLVNVTAILPDGASLVLRILQASGIATGNTLEALAGVWLVNRLASGCTAFLRVSDVFKYLKKK